MNKFSIFGAVLVVMASVAASPAHADRYGRNDGHRQQRWHENDRCNNCGWVERIERGGRRGGSGAGGAVAGAIIGGAVGNQVGSGDGRKAATVAGAVIGGIVGNNVSRDRNRRDVYEILVRMDRGQPRWFTQSELRGVRTGSRVEVNSGRVRLR